MHFVRWWKSILLLALLLQKLTGEIIVRKYILFLLFLIKHTSVLIKKNFFVIHRLFFLCLMFILVYIMVLLCFYFFVNIIGQGFWGLRGSCVKHFWFHPQRFVWGCNRRIGEKGTHSALLSWYICVIICGAMEDNPMIYICFSSQKLLSAFICFLYIWHHSACMLERTLCITSFFLLFRSL